MRPHVHCTNATGVPEYGHAPPDHFDVDLTIEVKNMGRGAAINIAGIVDCDDPPLIQSSGPANLPGDGALGSLAFRATSVPAKPFYDSLPRDFVLTLKYRDVAARDWQTHAKVRASTPSVVTSVPPVAFELLDEFEVIEFVGSTVPRAVVRK